MKQEEDLVTVQLSSRWHCANQKPLPMASPGLAYWGHSALETIHTSQRRISKPDSPFPKPWILVVTAHNPC